MNSIVLDASIVITAYLSQERSLKKKCYMLLLQVERKEIVAYAPEFLKTEVANGLWSTTRDAKYVTEMMDNFLSIPITYITPTDEEVLQSIDIAGNVNDTIYDATYHSLALSRGCIFTTRDKKYFKKASHLGNIEFLE